MPTSGNSGGDRAGFVDDREAVDGQETVFVPAFGADAAGETVMVPAHSDELPSSEIEPRAPEVSRKRRAEPSSVDISDLQEDLWADAEDGPAAERTRWDGDSPIAAPLDAPADRRRAGDAFERPTQPPAGFGMARTIEKAAAPGRGVLTVSELARNARRPVPITPPKPIPSRQYPKMLALLANPNGIPAGLPLEEPRPPPVPGTFIPSRSFERPEERTDIDTLLGAMAEGLLVGGTRESTQMVVSLRDDFFRGTELRVSIERGRITAKLVPPDHETYRQLSAELHRLEDRLAERGLKVAELRVERP